MHTCNYINAMLYSYTYVHTDDGDDDDMLFSFGPEAGCGVHEELKRYLKVKQCL